MAKVDAEMLSAHFKTRMEQRLTHWIRRVEGPNLNDIKNELRLLKWWQFKKKKDCEKRLLTAYLEIETLKAVILEVRRLV